ncbi:hypothetical protein D3C85_905030 [compost metagenome]
MAAVGLEHHRAAGGQGGGGVATGGGEGQGEVAGAEHRHRAEADAVLAQVRARQRLALRQGAVDARAVKVAAAQQLGEQAQLAAGAATLALDARGRQRGLAADDGDEVIAEGIDLGGDGLEELGAARGRQAAIGRIGRRRSLGGSVHLGCGSLAEGVRQRLAAVGVEAIKLHSAQRAAAGTDEILSRNDGHRCLLDLGGTGKRRRGWWRRWT